MSMNVKDYIRTIVDFPHEGIMFRDVTTLFADARGFRIAIDQLLAPYAGSRIDKVVGLEARGFILGGAVAHQLSTGFVPVRKKGKLPGAVISQAYQLEYGEAVVEISVKLVSDRSGRIATTRIFTGRVPVGTVDAANAAQSLDRALSIVLVNIVRFVGTGRPAEAPST